MKRKLAAGINIKGQECFFQVIKRLAHLFRVFWFIFFGNKPTRENRCASEAFDNLLKVTVDLGSGRR